MSQIEQVITPIPKEVVGLLGLVDKRYKLAAEASLARKAVAKTVQKYTKETRKQGVSRSQIDALLEQLIQNPSAETAQAIISARKIRAEIMARAAEETSKDRARLKELGPQIKELDSKIFESLGKSEIRRLLE
jgi:DNA-binding transcriptional MerR regulator